MKKATNKPVKKATKKVNEVVMIGEPVHYRKTVKEILHKSVCKKAEEIINGDRAAAYGTVTSNFSNIADMWSVILGKEVTAQQVGLCMIAVKMCREVNKTNVDNLVDIAGYAGCIEKLYMNQ